MQKNNTKTALVSKKTERFRQKKLKSLKKQSVAVAVPVKNTVAASEKARLCVSFGIEAHKLEAVVRTAGGERKTELTEIAPNGKILTFKVAAYDEAGLIGEGTHQRAIVAKERFEQKAQSKLAK